jgi:hypothetical protein
VGWNRETPTELAGHQGFERATPPLPSASQLPRTSLIRASPKSYYQI